MRQVIVKFASFYRLVILDGVKFHQIYDVMWVEDYRSAPFCDWSAEAINIIESWPA